MPAPTEVDAEVLLRARRGDREAHAELYRAFSPMVFTVARRMLGSTPLAEDVLQDSFVEVIRNAARYRGDASIGAWIRRIAINKCLTYLRSPWVVRRAGTVGPDDAAPIADAAAVADAAADAAGSAGNFAREPTGIDAFTQIELLRALDTLSDSARAVVWLHDVEGYTHREIAGLMDRSTSFSKSQLMRAYQQLRGALAPKSAVESASPESLAREPVASSADATKGESKPCMALKTV